MSVALPRVASAQRVDGSMGVSLTILPAGAAQTVRVTGFHLDRDGNVALRTTAPIAVHASQILSTRVTSSARGLGPGRYEPALPCAARATECAEHELRSRVDVGRPADGAGPRAVRVRVEYLVVPGT